LRPAGNREPLTHQLVVVDLAVIAQPEVRVAVYAVRLHAEQVVDDGEAVKAERTVLEVVHILDAEAVRAAVPDLETTSTLL